MQQRSTMSYFYASGLVTAAGLVLAGWLGWLYTGTVAGVLQFLFIGAILSVLEISLSFDNAIVNANKLKTMSEKWRRAFLTWGILIAVFGMRILFPVLIVVVAAGIGPIEAITLAATEPEEYAHIVEGAHLQIAAFGGTFLMMVALSFFFDSEKSIHWIGGPERAMVKMSHAEGIAVGIVVAVILGFAAVLPENQVMVFVISALYGLLTFLAVEVLGHFLDASDKALKGAASGGLGAFLYLEVLDASFSFDGVIGAFALTQNLFLIAIGLGIGAMYVRSMTIMLVDKGTLSEYRFLEHGAFWSIMILALVMFAQTLVHVPEVITGLLGATFIGVSLWSSLRWNRKNPDRNEETFDTKEATA